MCRVAAYRLGMVLILLHMCRHTTIYVSLYIYVCIYILPIYGPMTHMPLKRAELHRFSELVKLVVKLVVI